MSEIKMEDKILTELQECCITMNKIQTGIARLRMNGFGWLLQYRQKNSYDAHWEKILEDFTLQRRYHPLSRSYYMYHKYSRAVCYNMVPWRCRDAYEIWYKVYEIRYGLNYSSGVKEWLNTFCQNFSSFRKAESYIIRQLGGDGNVMRSEKLPKFVSRFFSTTPNRASLPKVRPQ